MKNIYRHTERLFEKLTSLTIAIMGNSITFMLALFTVIIWLTDRQYKRQDIHYRMGILFLELLF